MGFPERDGHTGYWAGWDSLPGEANPYEDDPAWAYQWQQGRDNHQAERNKAFAKQVMSDAIHTTLGGT